MKKLALASALVLAAAPAMAHPGHEFGVLAGVLHPLTGADHLGAMLAVGLWSGYAGRPLAGAATFLCAMVAGAALGFAGVQLPFVEAAILASVLCFGLLVAFGADRRAALGVIGVFALAHGQAHAAEAVGAVPAYLAGFLASTAALHLGGIALARRLASSRVALGLGIAGAGLWMMVG